MITARCAANGELQSITINSGRHARQYSAVDIIEVIAQIDRRRAAKTPAQHTLADIAERAATVFGVSILRVTGACRHRLSVLARAAAVHVARAAGYSLVEIGMALGGRNHSTVKHAGARAVVLLASSPWFAERLALVQG